MHCINDISLCIIMCVCVGVGVCIVVYTCA